MKALHINIIAVVALLLYPSRLAAAASSSSASSAVGTVSFHPPQPQHRHDGEETRCSSFMHTPYNKQVGAATWLQESLGDLLPFADREIVRWSTFNSPLVDSNLNSRSSSSSSNNSNNHLSRQQRRLQEADSISTYPGDDLIVVVTFRDIYKVILFIAVAWFLGTLSVYVGLPSLVGEIAAGFLLGPPLADFVPFPGALVLTGNIGLIGLILESGISLDVAQLKEVGSRALLLAIVGSVLPLLTGFGLGRWIGKDVKSAIAVGAAFAPSSLGVASNALSSGDVLNTPIGQMIVASSVFDDVFGLILLSILNVFADPNPTTFQYILPFIASFGYLIVLGLLGITVLPRLLETKILPLVSEANRDQFAMVLLMLLTGVYMLALNYSGASYLTGVFLAGLTFSQLHGVHASFERQGKPLLSWLLRIFFAATIGFQVPITRFQDVYVVKWGFALLLAVFAKLPVGFCVPRFKTEKPDDFPYNPYVRDVLVTSLAMTCRGEFNVIVASYALSAGLFHPDVYSAVIFAILFGSIVSPLVLTKLLRYYNNLTTDYLDGKHPIERIGNTCDGYRPLFLAIQARTPVRWNLQEAFKRKLVENQLIIIDHRSWHTLGRQDIVGEDAVDVTEVFVQDTRMRVRVSNCFKNGSVRKTEETPDKTEAESSSGDEKGSLEIIESKTTESITPTRACVEEGIREDEAVEARCEEIKKALSECLSSDSAEDYVIQVSQWKAFIVDRSSSEESSSSDELPRPNRKQFYSFHSQSDFDKKEGGDTHEATPPVESAEEPPPTPVRRFFHRRTSSGVSDQHSFFGRSTSGVSEHHPEEGPTLAHTDLWEVDNTCHNACREGYTLTPDYAGHGVPHLTEGLGDDDPHRRRTPRHGRAVSFDAGILAAHITDRDRETSVIRDRLCGYVRHHEALPTLPES